MADGNRMQIRFLLIPAGVLLVLVGAAALWQHFRPADSPPGPTIAAGAARSSALGTQSPSGESPAPGREAPPPPADTVLAKVNGEAVFEKDVAMPPPAGASQVDDSWVREFRLERRIRLAYVRQFLAANAVSVPDDAVEQILEDMRKNPPSLSCPCCRFATLDAFMQSQYLTLDELREEIRERDGLRRYALAQWDAQYPEGPKRTEFLSKQAPALARRYAKLYQIFFNTFQQPDYAEVPDRVCAEALKKAQAAVARLRKGERFQDIARDVSEDNMSRADGGDLGCIPLDAFGKEFAAAVSALKPGEYSEPIATPWGYHIVLRESMADADVLDVLKNEYLDARTQEAMEAARKSARIERVAAAGPAE